LLLSCPSAHAAGAQDQRDRGLLRLAGYFVKWGPLAYGSPAEITYAYLDASRIYPGARNCAAMAPVQALLVPAGLSAETFDREVRAAFDLWSEAANLTFTRIEDTAQADLVIGASAGPEGVAFTNVMQKARPSGAFDGIGQAAICLDPSERWEAGIDGDPKSYNLRYVATHEIGHALGLDHQGRDRGVMGFAYQEKVATPDAIALAPTDIAAIARLYGPAEAPAAPTVMATARAAEPCSARVVAAVVGTTALAAACEPAQKPLPE
jgi:hypothetical protein